MSDCFVGEIRLFGFSRIPYGWRACDGSTLPIAGNEVLYALIGTTFGGDGSTNFKLPDLRGRVPISQGLAPPLSNRTVGQTGGEEAHALQTNEMPAHSHELLATSSAATTAVPGNNVRLATASSATAKLYAPQANVANYTDLAPSLTETGGSQRHDNMMPTQTGNYCIALIGLFPERP